MTATDALSPAQHLQLAEALYRESLSAPLSTRRVRLVMALLDALPDRLWAAGGGDREDILQFRRSVADRCAAMGLVAALGDGSAELVVEAVEVPLADYRALPIGDVMVSVYNQHTVPRVQVVTASQQRVLAHDVLRDALGWWTASGLVPVS